MICSRIALTCFAAIVALQAAAWAQSTATTAPADGEDVAKLFQSPPDQFRPWVYWMVMDGNLTREGITADLEAMSRAGIGGAIILEVNLSMIPRGPVDFMSGPWRELIRHALAEADRLGLEIALPAGPGWCGSGGPWVKPEQAMQHLVGSETQAVGPARFDAKLPEPQPRTPFFGEKTLTPELRKIWKEFRRDVAVLAFPTPPGNYRIPDIDEKALYYRAPYSSRPGVKPFLAADRTVLLGRQCIAPEQVVDLTAKLSPEGRLVWDVPPGNWTIVRFARTVTGQTTRPAPTPGLGLECDKFDRSALDAHFDAFLGTLIKTVGEPSHPGRGWTTLHFDSWEMGSQNWSERFRDEFRRRRGYDPLVYLPVMLGRVVGSVEVSERFLWDLRRTAQELVVENHGQRLKELGRRHGLKLSIEPYDLNPAGDLALGAAADVPMCEFWSKGMGFNTEFSAFEAVSIAHTGGRTIVGAEAFTAHNDAWRQHPASVKAQGDWALCCGVNRFVFHRYQHQPWLDRFPGMTFGPYGVHWDRTQTWWEMAGAYHAYLARCQMLLRRGLPVADILYLDLEGAPNVFRPPASATLAGLPDRRGYNFDGCAPGTLIERASVENGRIVFPDGMSYRLLVLPRFETMTPPLLRKIKQLVDAGATVVGAPPIKSPSLEHYPQCDAEIARLAAEIWRSNRVVRDAGAVGPAASQAALTTARWIWHREGNPAASAPVAKTHFRRSVDIAGPIESAVFVMTADNRFELFVNGRSAGQGDNFHEQYRMDVAPLLKPGQNAITVTAENTGDAPNPAGLIGTLAIRYRDGREQVIDTDGQWSTALTAEGPWHPAVELGKWNMAPWRLKNDPPAKEMYPAYETTAQVLAGMNVVPDFESDGDVRYTHRHDQNADIYFVGNRTPASLSATCRFRVTGLQPELWDPVTGQRRPLPEFHCTDGRTNIALRFAPGQSYFIVFRAGTRPAGVNFPELTVVGELTGSWDVTFDPKWGGPEKPVTIQTLQDWTQREEDGIRHYSGTAVYRKTFDLPAGGQGKPLMLDLGEVKNLARVKLNGQELGVVWCAPWRVTLPAGVLKRGGNQLEIQVANLWPNRLIKDAGLPREKRLTWTTWSPYRPTDPLLPSGLLGPVRVLE